MPRDRQDDAPPLPSRAMKDKFPARPGSDSARRHRSDVVASTADTSLFSGFIGYRLRLATNAMTSDLRATLEGTSLRPVLFAMLAVVARNPGIIQTALGNSLGVQRANLVPLLNELAERDLIERRPAPNDKRAYALFLTASGERILEEALDRIHEHEERLVARLTARERETLKRLLAKIAGNGS
jgi:DNA-binding MarR family transcriptional regulator